MTRGPLIAVCGGAAAGRAALEDARQAGELLARAGAIVICGGLGGVMEAAALGARSGGGISVGLLPGWDAGEAPEALTVAIPTGLEEIRNALIVRAARAVIAVDGGAGTLTEIALALRLGRPVAAIRSWEVHPPGSASPDPRVIAVAGAAEAVEGVLAEIRSRP